MDEDDPLFATFAENTDAVAADIGQLDGMASDTLAPVSQSSLRNSRSRSFSVTSMSLCASSGEE